MLLRFSITNYQSIKDTAEVSLVATALKEHSESVIPSRYTKHGILPVLSIYGANASGKSNLLMALGQIRNFVGNSFSFDEKKFGARHRPFLLDAESRHKPTTFTVDFILNDVRYQFGFSYNKERITEEWLYSYPKSFQTLLYSRDSSLDDPFEFGRALTGSNKQVQSITKPTSLFLSAAAKAGHATLEPIAEYFDKKMAVQLGTSANPGEYVAAELESDAALTEEVAKYLHMADTGVSSIKIEKSPIPEPERKQMADLFAAVTSILKSDIQDIGEIPTERPEIVFGHRGADGDTRYLNYSDESLGTRYFVSLLPSMIKALNCGGILILDEITTSLHTLLSKRLVELFQNSAINTHGAQLLFSTHDTNLLSSEIIRRDQIWFAEKSSDGRSEIYPLTDIKTKNTDNLERGYIQGRFGAVPFIDDLSS